MVVTIVALALGIGMSAVAWRLLRDSRSRSAARAAALQELAALPEEPGDEFPEEALELPPARPPANRGLLWSANDVRPAPRDWDSALRNPRPVPQARTTQQEVHADILASQHGRAGSGGRRWLAVAAVALVMAVSAAAIYARYGPAAIAVLHPGEESPFVVRVQVPGRVSRYRVGFRSEDGGAVAHVDRRGQLPDGTTGGSVDVPTRSHAVGLGKSES
jgi:hypothetical protein